MTVGTMIATDVLFVTVFITILVTGGLDEHAIILVPLLIVAFSTCAIRHIHHYKHTKRIY